MEIVLIIGAVIIIVLAVSSRSQASTGVLDFMSIPSGNLIPNPTGGVLAMADAIARAEGFYSPGSLPSKAHNPGDLTEGDFGDTGVYMTSSSGARIIVFPDDQSGWDALYRKLENIANGGSSVYSPNMTLSELAAKWTTTQQSSWASNVADSIGADLNSIVGGLLA